MVDALNCSQGCLYGTGIEEAKSEGDDNLENLWKIRENSMKKKGTLIARHADMKIVHPRLWLYTMK